MGVLRSCDQLIPGPFPTLPPSQGKGPVNKVARKRKKGEGRSLKRKEREELEKSKQEELEKRKRRELEKGKRDELERKKREELEKRERKKPKKKEKKRREELERQSREREMKWKMNGNRKEVKSWKDGESWERQIFKINLLS